MSTERGVTSIESDISGQLDSDHELELRIMMENSTTAEQTLRHESELPFEEAYS